MQLDRVKAPAAWDLNKIYTPIKQDLVKVEDITTSVCAGSLSPLVRQLFFNAKGGENIARLLAYSLDGGGKKLRPALALLSGKLFECASGLLLDLAAAVEILHTATLIHDDIIDKSALRRGRPTINAMWDSDKAILTGDFLLSKSLEFVSRTENLIVIKRFIETIVALCGGELTEHFNTFNTEQTREHYINTIASKTAALFSLATEAGAILSRAPEDSIRALKNYGYNFGLAFQIVDDILDFVGDEAEMGKPRGLDLTQGVITLPAMLLLERYPDANPIKELSERNYNKEKIEQVVQMVLEDPTIIDESYAVAVKYADLAGQDLEFMPDCPSRDSLVDLTGYIVRRKK